jgi:hypothetical protein
MVLLTPRIATDVGDTGTSSDRLADRAHPIQTVWLALRDAFLQMTDVICLGTALSLVPGASRTIFIQLIRRLRRGGERRLPDRDEIAANVDAMPSETSGVNGTLRSDRSVT